MIKWCQEASRKGLGTWGKCGLGKEEPEEKAAGRSLKEEKNMDHQVNKQKSWASPDQIAEPQNHKTKGMKQPNL